MLPEFPEATRCVNCLHFFFFEDASGIDAQDDGKKNGIIDNVAENLDWQECHAALLEHAPQTQTQENYLRFRLWWSANDHVRRPEQILPPPCPDNVFRENLLVLIRNLNGPEPGNKLMRAEALRELGHFAEAEEALHGAVPDDLAFAHSKISQLVRSRQTRVVRLT